MSKLPSAPLMEVIFELKWKMQEHDGLARYQYLPGDLFSELKSRYPFRQSLAPPEIPLDLLIHKPVYRFRVEEEEYPLFQVGPGIITLNTDDDNYYWEEYYDWAKELLSTFYKVYISSNESFVPYLRYIDFIALDFNSSNVLDYINENLQIKISQGFHESYQNPANVNLGFSYETDLGSFYFNLTRGKKNDVEGILLQNSLSGVAEQNVDSILLWLENSHEFLSNTFKKITKGSLYESFKNQNI